MSNTATASPSPGLPTKVEKEVTDSLTAQTRYILYFRRSSIHTEFTFIDFPSDRTLQQIVDRVKQYCNTCSMRFVRIEPMMTDMSKNEKVYGEG